MAFNDVISGGIWATKSVSTEPSISLRQWWVFAVGVVALSNVAIWIVF